MHGDTEVLKIMKGDEQKWPYLPYDAQVEFLQSDGTAYIDTAYTPVQGDEFYAEYEVLDTLVANTYHTLFSAGADTYQVVAMFGKNNSGEVWYARYFSSDTLRYFGSAGSKLSISSSGVVKVDNNNAGTKSYQSALDGNATTLWLLRRRNDTSPMKAKIKSFKITNGNTTKLDYIPVRKNGVGYLYDKVSGELFGNANSTGAFTYGNDV